MEKYAGITTSEANCDEILLGGRKSDWKLDDEMLFYSKPKQAIF